MTNEELVIELQKLPPKAKCFHLWDGETRTAIECVYLAKSGNIVTADFHQLATEDEDRPIGAPTPEEEKYWSTRWSDDVINKDV